MLICVVSLVAHQLFPPRRALRLHCSPCWSAGTTDSSFPSCSQRTDLTTSQARCTAGSEDHLHPPGTSPGWRQNIEFVRRLRYTYHTGQYRDDDKFAIYRPCNMVILRSILLHNITHTTIVCSVFLFSLKATLRHAASP